MAAHATSLKEFIQECVSDNCWTPDLPYLSKMYTHIPVFVYNQFRKGMREHGLLKPYPFIGYGRTNRPGFDVKMLDCEPIAFRTMNEQRMSKLYGEVYIIPTGHITALDKIMCNGYHMTRSLTLIDMSMTSSAPAYRTECWMYVGEPKNLDMYAQNFRDAPYVQIDGSNIFHYTSLQDIKRTDTRRAF